MRALSSGRQNAKLDKYRMLRALLKVGLSMQEVEKLGLRDATALAGINLYLEEKRNMQMEAILTILKGGR